MDSGWLRDGRSRLGFAAVVLSGCKGNAQPPAPPPPEVSVIEVKPGPVTVYNEYVAQTQAPDTIEIRSQVTGLLERQVFADGARVKKGDVLYVIDQRPFEAQLAQAKASLAQAEANLVNAKQNLARNSRLIAQKAVSQQDYDTAVAQERSSTALVEAQKALLRNVELNLEFATLRAPRDGFMSSSLVKPGSLITAQQTLLTTLYSSDPMWVNFSISEDRFLELQNTLKHPPGERPDHGAAVSHPACRRHRLHTSREAQLRRRDDRSEERDAAGAHLRAQSQSCLAPGPLRARHRRRVRKSERDQDSATGRSGAAGTEVGLRRRRRRQGGGAADRCQLPHRQRLGRRQRPRLPAIESWSRESARCKPGAPVKPVVAAVPPAAIPARGFARRPQEVDAGRLVSAVILAAGQIA